MRRNGIINSVKDNKLKKIKYYYLTNYGIDFYHVVTELFLKTKKHLNKGFHTLSVLAFKEIDLKIADAHNKEFKKA